MAWTPQTGVAGVSAAATELRSVWGGRAECDQFDAGCWMLDAGGRGPAEKTDMHLGDFDFRYGEPSRSSCGNIES